MAGDGNPHSVRRRFAGPAFILLAGLITSTASAATLTVTNYIGSTVVVTSALGNYEATLIRVIDPAPAGALSLPPDAGTHYVGIDFNVRNTGNSNLQVSIADDATAADARQHSFDSQFGDSISGCSTLDPSLTLAPSTTSSGCVVFLVPNGDHLTKVFVGSGGETPAVWTLSLRPSPSKYAAVLLEIHPTTASLFDYKIKVTNVGGSAGAPTCKTTLSGPSQRYNYFDTEKLPRIAEGSSITATFDDARLPSPVARKLTVGQSFVACR